MCVCVCVCLCAYVQGYWMSGMASGFCFPQIYKKHVNSPFIYKMIQNTVTTLINDRPELHQVSQKVLFDSDYIYNSSYDCAVLVNMPLYSTSLAPFPCEKRQKFNVICEPIQIHAKMKSIILKRMFPCRPNEVFISSRCISIVVSRTYRCLHQDLPLHYQQFLSYMFTWMKFIDAIYISAVSTKQSKCKALYKNITLSSYIDWNLIETKCDAFKYSLCQGKIIESHHNNCSLFEFRCGDGTCILLKYKCDRKFDCNDHEDELNCSESMFEVRTYTLCDYKNIEVLMDINIDIFDCNGRQDCITSNDEINCRLSIYNSEVKDYCSKHCVSRHCSD